MFVARFWSLSPFYSPVGDEGGGGDPKPLTQDDVNTAAAAARREAERDVQKKVDDAVAAALAKAKTDADTEAQRVKDEESGNFKPIREGLERERDEAKRIAGEKEAEAADKAARLEKAEKLLKGRLDERVKALDHEDLKDVKADYLARFPDDTAPLLDRLDYLDDPRTAAAIGKVEQSTTDRNAAFRIVGGTIPPASGPLTDAQRVERAHREKSATGQYDQF